MKVSSRFVVILFFYVFQSQDMQHNTLGESFISEGRSSDICKVTPENQHTKILPRTLEHVSSEESNNSYQYLNTNNTNNKVITSPVNTKKLKPASVKNKDLNNKESPNKPELVSSTSLPIEKEGVYSYLFYNIIPLIYMTTISVLITWKHFQTHRSKANVTTQAFEDPRKSAEYLRAVFETISVGVIATNNQMKVTYINSNAAWMCGWNASRAIGKPVASVARLVSRNDKDPINEMQEDGTLLLETVDGRRIDVRKSVAPLTVGNEVSGVVMLLQDMTVSCEMMKKLSHCASHDALTGLPNRASFERRLYNAVNNSIEYSTHHTLVFLDLDGFKKVNDSCGHAAGDELLVQIARLMQCQLRCGDFLARLGGDEFGVVLFDCSLDQGKMLAENLVRKVKDHVFFWDGKSNRVGASAGLTGISDETRSIGELLRRADDGCYTAKSRGKGQVYVFDDSEVFQSK